MKSKTLDTTNLLLPDGSDAYRTISITYRETVDFQGFKFHTDWMNNLYDFKNRVVKKTYHKSKKDAEIKFYSPYQDTLVTDTYQNASFKLYGMQFTGFEDLQLQNESGGPLTITCNYEIERLEYDLGRVSLRKSTKPLLR